MATRSKVRCQDCGRWVTELTLAQTADEIIQLCRRCFAVREYSYCLHGQLVPRPFVTHITTLR